MYYFSYYRDVKLYYKNNTKEQREFSALLLHDKFNLHDKFYEEIKVKNR